MSVKHNLQIFQCSCTLFKDSYIDYTFKDEAIMESKIVNIIHIYMDLLCKYRFHLLQECFYSFIYIITFVKII